MAASIKTGVGAEVKSQGFAVVEDVLDAKIVDRFRSLVENARQGEHDQNVANAQGVYGLRNLTDVVPEVTELARHAGICELVEEVIGPKPFVVRATLFDKTATANWGVFWHQDLSIAVRQRHELAGFDAWTRKAGVACVQPPTDLMEKILAVRLHLDDCTASNGALKVLPETHRLQKLNSADVAKSQSNVNERVCEVAAGGIVMMRPLLLHASSPMEKPTSRRVIHLEFANFDLPKPLEWQFRIM